jgi:thioredoxin-dependent peroxiredoxin
MKLQVGDKAPDFSLNNQDGKLTSLSDFKGKKLVIYFYPKDDTPGCTAQACDLRDNIDKLKSQGYTLLGVSIDTEKSHQKFIKKHALNFDLLADVDQKMVNDYKLWVEKSMYGKTYMGTARTTFKIDENGIITDIIEKVDTKNHTAQLV